MAVEAASSGSSEGYACLESGWCDYSPEHRVLRERLEKSIMEYWRGNGVRLPVIVAPYGSGKTKLLEHLEWFAAKQGIPVVRVELAAIVAFLRSRGGVHESGLVRVFEEFFKEKTGLERGLLLVDEVEEAYDQLASLVEYETSPFRGLADAVYRGEAGVLPILAFGPSSMLKEAVFGPVAWRSMVLQIPLMPPSAIERLVAGEAPPGLARLVANTIWWASKGRPGWVRLAADAVLEAVRILAAGRAEEAFEKLASSEALSVEVVEGVPLLDRKTLRELERETGSPSLAAFLALFAGPVPIGLVEDLGIDALLAGGTAYTVSRAIAYLDELLEKAEHYLARIARAENIGQQSLDHALYVLRLVAQAWSREGYVAYDPSSLNELAVLASDIARELYPSDTGAHSLLEKLGFDLIGIRAERLRSPVVAVKPSYIAKLYPLASSTPLVACARRANASQVVGLVDSLEPGEVIEYSRSVAEDLGLTSGVVVAPIGVLKREPEKMVCSAAGKTLLVAIPPGAGEEVPRIVEAASSLGFLRVAIVAGKPGLLIYSLFYNYATTCSTRLSGPETHVLRVYRAAIEASLHDATGGTPPQELLELEAAASKLAEALGGGEAVEPLLELLLALRGKGLPGEAVEEIRALLGGEIGETVAELLEAIKPVDSNVLSSIPPCLVELMRKRYRYLSLLLSPQSTGSGEPYLGDLEAVVEAARAKLESITEGMPEKGLVLEAKRVLRELEAVKEHTRRLLEITKCGCSIRLGEILARTRAKQLENMLSKIEEIKRQYQGLLEMASKLPEQASRVALESLREALVDALVEESIEPLVEVSEPLAALLMYAGKAEEYEAKIAELAGAIEEVIAEITGSGEQLAPSSQGVAETAA